MTQNKSNKTKPAIPRRVRMAIHIALVIGAIAGGWFIFEKNYARYLWVRNWGVVEEGRFYRSALPETRLIRKTMVDNSITRIINLQGWDPDNPKQVAQKQLIAELGIKEIRFPMKGNGTPRKGNPDDSQTPKGQRRRAEVYANAIEAMVTELADGQVVWIQCGAGTHRTGGTIACFRMLVQQWPADKAYAELQSHGWTPRKHRALTDWINSHMLLIAEGLVARGVIDSVPDPLPHLGPVRDGEPPLITNAPPANPS